MIRSLLIKFGMLAVTIGVVLWIGWQTPDLSLKQAASVDDSQAAVLLSPVTTESEASQSSRFNNGSLGGAAPRRVVDLNSATVKELESLPGIGAVLAERVIAYRKSVGRFQTVEDLREVTGIGSKKFDRLKPLVTVAAAEMKGKAEKRPL
jgi:competence protein ComEA